MIQTVQKPIEVLQIQYEDVVYLPIQKAQVPVIQRAEADGGAPDSI